MLAGLTGMEESDLRKFLRVLDACGHQAGGALHLTQSGQQSAARRHKVACFGSRQVLLCDGLTGLPSHRTCTGPSVGARRTAEFLGAAAAGVGV